MFLSTSRTPPITSAFIAVLFLATRVAASDVLFDTNHHQGVLCNTPPAANGLMFERLQGIEATSVAPVLGDFNGNGIVDAADYTVWKDTFGSSSILNADANSDGNVEAADYTIWKDNYYGHYVSEMNTVPVPEPTGTVMIATALLLIGAARRYASNPA
ncbi:MAG: dockerin type I repeat-containing protein [Pirellulaceae bacterium]|nr:dockerin type I repeat-containing protein [Planctomycetales bacterium]